MFSAFNIHRRHFSEVKFAALFICYGIIISLPTNI